MSETPVSANEQSPTLAETVMMCPTAYVDQCALASMVSDYYSLGPNPVRPSIEEYTGTIAAIAKTLSTGQPASQPNTEAVAKPLTNPKKTIHPDYIICLEDGLHFRSLKRHLTKLGMTPEQYREKWGLPANYPMVAPNYKEKRSQLAKESGLGSRRKKAAA